MPTPLQSKRVPFFVLAAGNLALLGLTTWMLRKVLLDDSYIHLRFARNLLEGRGFSYNPGQPSFGTSSPLYAMMIGQIGALVEFSSWPLIPKLLSVAASFFSLIFFVCFSYCNLEKHLFGMDLPKRRLAWSLVFLSLMLFSVPSAARWLQDGMETSLAVLVILLQGFVLRRWFDHHARPSLGQCAATAAALALPGILRIDLLSICASSFGLLALFDRRRGRLRTVILGLLMLGAWYALVYSIFQRIVPDGAVAKQTGHFAWSWFAAFFKTMGSISPAWLAGPVLLTIAACSLERKAETWKTLIYLGLGVLPLVAVVLAGAAKGQFLQGPRYFLPHTLFSLLMFLMLLREKPGSRVPTLRRGFGLCTGALLAILAASAVHAALTWDRMQVIAEGSFLSIPAEISGVSKKILVRDVGLVGWFSDAQILDPSGLINGPKVARAAGQERLCLAVDSVGLPDALVITLDQTDPPGTVEQAIRCGTQQASYRKTEQVVMKVSTLSRTDSYYLWRRIPESPDFG